MLHRIIQQVSNYLRKTAYDSPAGRAIKAERKLSVSLFAFNETVVCVNNKTNQKRYFI